MKKQTYRMLVVALASVLVAPPLSAFAQREAGPRGARLAPTQNFGGHVYHGQLAWRDGRWHHTTRNGRFGWWWDVGGVWYFYPEPVEAPPAYVSDIEVADEATAAHPPPEESRHAFFYYRPGELKGTPYQTIEECWQASQKAGNVGVCVMKSYERAADQMAPPPSTEILRNTK